MRKFNRVKIYKNNSLKTQKVAKALIRELKENQYDVGDDFCDLAISIGGDGTFLRMVHESMFDDAICYVGIHTGSLGFLQEIDIDLCPDFVTKLNQNEFREETKGIQETKIITKNGEYYFAGDAQYEIEGPIRRDQIEAVEDKVMRKGKWITGFSPEALFFRYIWIRIIFARKYVVKAYRGIKKL